MKETIIYGIAGVSSLFILGYSVHMLVGGLVSRHTELILITLASLAGIAAIVYMVRDVIQRRKKRQ